MIQDDFKFYKPCRMLQPFVRFYWAFRSDMRLNTLSFPLGCTQIIFHRKKPLYIPEFCVTQDRLTISGQVNFSSHLRSEGDLDMIVVVFHPHAMSAFLNVPTSLFYNIETSGYNLEDLSLNELTERIFDSKSDETAINLIENWLLALPAVRPKRFVKSAELMLPYGGFSAFRRQRWAIWHQLHALARNSSRENSVRSSASILRNMRESSAFNGLCY